MDNDGNKTEMQKLTRILTTVQNLYQKKQEQLEELQLEISELKILLSNLNSLISNKSFQSADEIYVESLNKFELSDQYFDENISKEMVKDTKIKRKIFDDSTNDLLCILNFMDFNRIEIKIINPFETAIKETSEDFIKVFLKGALINIKENNPDLVVDYQFYKDSDIIESIEISNFSSINDYDLITLKMRQLLLKTPQKKS